MKKLIFLIMFLQVTTALAELNVLTCEPEWMSLAKELGGDKLNLQSATTGLQDPHHIEARPSLLAKARQADLLICTGADLEIGWLPLLIRKSGNNKIQAMQDGYFMATDYTLLLEKPDTLDRGQGDIHAPGNPHIQMDPQRLLDVAEALSERLQQLDSENKAYYQAQFQSFSLRWNKAMIEWKNKAASLAGMKIITYHRSWVYLQQWLGLSLVATIEPKPAVPPSSGYLAQLVKQARNEQVTVIIHAAYTNPKAASWLSDKTDIPVVKLPYTVGGSKQVTDLFNLFDVTLNLLSEVAHGH